MLRLEKTVGKQKMTGTKKDKSAINISLHGLVFLLSFMTLIMTVKQVNAAAGLMTGGAILLEPLTLSAVEPLAAAPYELQSGKYYKIDINSDGSAELGLSGAEFFRNIWIDEVIINDIEIRPLGLDSLEFDDEGTATIKFIAIRPGSFIVRIPGTTGDSQQAVFTIR